MNIMNMENKIEVYDRYTQTYFSQTAENNRNVKENSEKVSGNMKDSVEISGEGLYAMEEYKAAQMRDFVQQIKSSMSNRLTVTFDPKGEIENSIYWEEYARQLNEMIDTIKDYYAKEHEKNLNCKELSPYNYIVAKYKFPDSPYYRFDMSMEEREMAFRQERALLWGSGLNLNDPYALAATGGVRDIDKLARQATEERLKQLAHEFAKGGENHE
ncbi:MAG: hypothetical protein J6K58_00185 [Lachnospiraceae bacterium]|nr:hypothetical protein [Lachnospiraceae bacterium]